MKVLHTSDWHLGQLLKQRKRDEEHRAFLAWLLDTLKEEGIELFLIAGDIFDSGLPPNYALEMYYAFLSRCVAQGCRSVIVIGGNHDSPAVLQAPKPVLGAINVTVTGIRNREQPANDIALVSDAAGNPAALVCAIPFLRDQDVYTPRAGEQGDFRTQGIVRGTADWYRRQVDLALVRRQELGLPDLPIIATGHLFAEGTSLAGSERELYIGNLGAFPAACFPQEAAYIALGHLHRPQIVPNHPRVRYSGSPIPCSFDEASHEKQVLVFDTASPGEVRPIPVPVFRRLATVRGDLATIGQRMNELAHAPLKTWVFAEYTGDTLLPDLEDRVTDLAESLPVDIIGCQDLSHRVRLPDEPQGYASEPTPEEVFERCAERSGLSPNDRLLVREAFQEVCLEIRGEERA
ncbi:MAG TPA: exonuclease SbcCD subunit D C-terminal domain-containing protein [Candidatus Ozemobacteraceae bacterium]